MAYIDYTDPSQAMERWITEIAPKYFNFDTSELHRSGIFGYVNDVMATVSTDGSRAMSNARREFYPTTAIWEKSFYKMGALHKLSYPLANPAKATMLIMLKESEIINYAEVINGKYKFVLDNNMTILAGEIEFMLDYPIIIQATKKRVGSSVLSQNDDNLTSTIKYAYTVRYDMTYKNSLNSQTSPYITARTAVYAGETFLIMKVSGRQVVKSMSMQTITKSPTVTNVSLDFPFDGQLANFEVFYREANSSNTYQLIKLPQNSSPINGKFCMFQMLKHNVIRINFPMNAYFTPKFNSIIEIHIYTTRGVGGNKPQYDLDLICNSDSELYPYNKMVSVLGQIRGSSIGGTDLPTIDDFKQTVITAYATNNVYVTEKDLQSSFDLIADLSRNKILFFKKRDDVFERLFGAYMLIKDLNANVIPTNTLTMELMNDDLDAYSNVTNKAIIKPGKVWKYQDSTKYYSSVYNVYPTKLSLNTDINDSITDFCYVNPFLINVSIDANAVGYYINTMDDVVPMNAVNINSNSYIQFNTNSLKIHRNAIRDENFYKISIHMSPSVHHSDLEKMLITTPEELSESANDNWPTQIRAEYDGIVEGYTYYNSSVFVIIRYTPPEGSTATYSSLTKYVEEPGMFTSEQDLRIYIRVSSSLISYISNETGQRLFNTNTWYITNLQPGDSFTAGSIIAYRKLRDNGILRVIGELNGDTSDLFLPFIIEDYVENGDYYVLSTYMSTSDTINDDGRLEIIHGFFSNDGTARDYVSVDPTDCYLKLSIFLQYDDINYSHDYGNNIYVKQHTFTNSYYNQDQAFNLIKPVKFIRSTLSFNQLPSEGDDINYFLRVKSVPLVRANWMKNEGNIYDLINMINTNYDYIMGVYNLLENCFSIDLKFFNTYGKSRFYRIGIGDTMETIDRVNVVPKFGIKLNALTSYDEFKSRFILFVRDYIESFNGVDNTGKSLHMMELVTSIQNNFSEIERFEYYGIDNYTSNNAQNIEAMSDDEIRALGYNQYVPEFINIYCEYIECELVPQISITILQ